MDKIGNVTNGFDKRVAQSATDFTPFEGAKPSFSRRGQGHGWKNGYDHQMPLLFGSGGHADGETALIQTNSNRQVEDEAALHGNGADAIDSNKFQRNQANANVEFNFSQYKTGAVHSQRGKTLPGEGMFTVATTDGAVSGDTTLRVDPYAAIVDATSQALGAVYGSVFRAEQANQDRGPVLGVNPFQHRLEKTKEKDEEAKAPIEATTMEEDDKENDYYFDETYHAGKAAEESIQDDFDTGLRRVNMKTTQGRQLAAVATKEQITSAYQQANDQYAQVVKDHMGKAYLQNDDRTDMLSKFRTNTSKYQASQMGVGSVSRERSKYFHSKKGEGTTKLNTILVGV